MPVTALQRETAKKVRRIVKKYFDYWFSYNDGHKDGSRRLKMMRNGHDYGTKQYKAWDKAIKAEFEAAGVEVQTAGFETCERPGYGDYEAYIVRLAP